MFDIFVFTSSLALLGLLFLLGLALLVQALISRQKSLRTVSLIVFLCFAFLCGSTSGYAGRKAVNVAYFAARVFSGGIKFVLNKAIVEGASIIWNDDRTYLLDRPLSPQIRLLQSYVPEDVRSTINPQYYTYFGFRDWWRFPLVWPYGVHTVDVIDYGCLYDESAVGDYAGGVSYYAGDMGICGITHLALDKHFLLVRTLPKYSVNPSQAKYFIFNFEIREQTSFSSETEMFARAKELGFEGKLELLSLKEYDALFW